jgi:1-acyl-sn-glycerol-3-phosphate acyltransferase
MWIAYWNSLRVYHRYEVHGLWHLGEMKTPALIVGYHGRPFAHDLCMLQMLLLERTGQMPSAIVHESMTKSPPLSWIVEGMEFVAGDDDSISKAIKQGKSLIVTPGGTREACRSYRDRYEVNWGQRFGYLRLAMKFKLPIVPAAASGVDDAYLGLFNGYELAKTLKLPGKLPPWIGAGPFGMWPLSPPFPVKVVQCLGTPICDHLMGADESESDSENRRLQAIDRRVRRAVQRLLDERGAW